MKCIGFIFCLCSAMLANVHADSFADANANYQTGDFKAAAAGYEHALTDRGADAAVYYNLGNALQQQKDYGRAILAYERARLLTPRDPDLNANLTLARKAAAAFEETPPPFDKFVRMLSRNEWSWLVAGAALTLGVVALIASLRRLPRNGWRQTAIAISILAGVSIAIGSTALMRRRGENRLGVVITDKAPFRLSPFATAEPVGTAAWGRTIHLGETKSGFHYVEMADLHGWIADADAPLIQK